jgi:hypothetical protein
MRCDTLEKATRGSADDGSAVASERVVYDGVEGMVFDAVVERLERYSEWSGCIGGRFDAWVVCGRAVEFLLEVSPTVTEG